MNISTPGKPVSVPQPGRTKALPIATQWGTAGPKQPGIDAGNAPGPPQFPTQTPAPKPAAPAPAPTPQNSPTGPPAQSPAPGPFSMGSILAGGAGRAAGGAAAGAAKGVSASMSDLGSMLNSKIPSVYGETAKATESTPPLSFLTHHLGGAQQPVDSVLKGIQSAVKGDPARFAGLAGGLAPGLTSGLLSAGPMGMAALPGLYGLLSGGDSFAAANQFFKPVLPKLGLG